MANNGMNGIDGAIARADEIARGLRATSAQSQGAEEAARRLLSVSRDQGAAGDELRLTVEQIAAGVEQTAATLQTAARGQQRSSESAREVAEGLTATSTA